MIITGMVLKDDETISLVDICKRYHFSEDLLTEMVEQGLLPLSMEADLNRVKLNHHMLNRVLSARRLQEDLGINISGVVLVLDLLEDLERTRNELNILQRYFKTFD